MSLTTGISVVVQAERGVFLLKACRLLIQFVTNFKRFVSDMVVRF